MTCIALAISSPLAPASNMALAIVLVSSAISSGSSRAPEEALAMAFLQWRSNYCLTLIN